MSEDESQVWYRDAWGDGLHLRYTIWHARGVRATREAVIDRMPHGDSEFVKASWLVRAPSVRAISDGRPVFSESRFATVYGRGLSIHQDSHGDLSQSRGAGLRKPQAWYYSSTGELTAIDLKVDIEVLSDGETARFTKWIPRSFIAKGLASGGSVFADDTTVFRPDANTETSTVDGRVRESGVSDDWSTIHDAAGTDANDSTGNLASAVGFAEDSTMDSWASLSRYIALFDTSSLTSDATITSATLKFKKFGTTEDGHYAGAVVVSSSPASNTALVAGDYDSTGTTAYSDVIDYFDITGAAFKTFTLNASGEAAISLTGITKLAIVEDYYDRANYDPGWMDGATVTKLGIKTADATGTASDPKLTVNYTLPAAGAPLVFHHMRMQGM